MPPHPHPFAHSGSCANGVSPGGLGTCPEDGESMSDAADANLGQIITAEQRERAAVDVVQLELVRVLAQANRHEPVADGCHIPRLQP